MAAPTYIDLTELLAKTGGPDTYYGIARVVAEIGAALFRSDGDYRFMVFNLGDRRFYELSPKADDSELGVDFGVPQIKLRHVRHVVHDDGPVRRAGYAVLQGVARRHNTRIDEAVRQLPPADLNGARVFSAGRVKLITEMISAAEDLALEVDWQVLCHDLIPLHEGKDGGNDARFQRRYLDDIAYVFTRATRIIANSQFTADDIQEHADQGYVPAPRAMATLPLVHQSPDGGTPPSVTIPQAPYFMMLGTSLGRKNLDVVLEAFKILKAQDREMPRLVLAGRERHRTTAFLEKPEQAQIAPHVMTVPDPPQSDLNRLYAHASALLLPSRIEGWGLPAGEALWNGTPAIVADTPIMHEVCGDLAWYFGPDDADMLAKHLARLLDEPQTELEWRRRIAAARPSLRRWEDVGRDLITILRG